MEIKIVAFFAFWIVFSNCVFTQNDSFPGKISITLNGEEASSESLIHQVFCLDGGDKFEISFIPEEKDTTAQYVLLGVDLWAQVQLGRPNLLGRIEKSDPAYSPTVKFQLKDLEKKSKVPPAFQATRGSLQIQRILKVEGNRMIAVYNVPAKEGLFYLSMIQDCKGQSENGGK